jgi:hypothetical protein
MQLFCSQWAPRTHPGARCRRLERPTLAQGCGFVIHGLNEVLLPVPGGVGGVNAQYTAALRRVPGQ